MITRDTELELEKLQFMINEVPEIAHAVKNLSKHLAIQDLKQCVRYTLGHSDEWLFLTVQDKPRKPNEVATIEVFTDADWAGDGLYVKAILDDLGMQAKINLRCDAKAARALWHRDKVCPSVPDT